MAYQSLNRYRPAYSTRQAFTDCGIKMSNLRKSKYETAANYNLKCPFQSHFSPKSLSYHLRLVKLTSCIWNWFTTVPYIQCTTNSNASLYTSLLKQVLIFITRLVFVWTFSVGLRRLNCSYEWIHGFPILLVSVFEVIFSHLFWVGLPSGA